MSNKIISIGEQTKTDVSKEIYVDIDMDSQLNIPDGVDWNEYYYYLNTEEKDEKTYQHICKVVTEEDRQEIYLAYNKTKSYEKAIDEWRRKSRFRIKKSININAIFNSLKNIFTWIVGERILNPEFGSNIRRLLYEQITSVTEERIVAEINQAVLRWEPRIQIIHVVNAGNVEDTEDNTIRLEIKFKIRGLEDVYTYTYTQDNNK